MDGLFEATELVVSAGDEPRMSAGLLADRLGIARRQTMMRLIERNEEALRRFGEYLATVAKYSGRRRGQPEKDYLLNEGQAIYIASRSDTPLATEVHIALVMVFMEWRAGRLVSDHAEMAAKRAYFDALPERHKARARANAAAVRRVEDLIASGCRVNAAIAEVAEAVGLGERTLHSYRRIVWPVPEADWPLALAPRWSGRPGMVTDCHPEVLRLFLGLRASGARVSDCYRRVVDEAQANGWAPVPPQYTLRRAWLRLAAPKAKKEFA